MSAVRFLPDLPGSGVESGDPVVALTFDDGPRPPGTAAVLDALRAAAVHATFFLVGEKVAAHPDLVRSIVADGHTVGLHGWTHTRFTELDDAALGTELDRAGDLLGELTGASPRLVRPPYGTFDERVDELLRARDLVPVKWSVDPEDWRCPDSETLTERVLADVAPGRIVLLHDGIASAPLTVAAVPSIAHGLRRAGYRLVTL
jgi:peptidoglycan-N-acetylglucosamine deacetylase